MRKTFGRSAAIDVNEIQNTGTFEARLKIPEGDLVLAMGKWNEFSPCQNGGIVAYIHEHGTDSGCGDNNWPKTVGFLAGWGFGHATQHIDFYIRSPQMNPKNKPMREVFMHFFGMEITWK